MVMTGGAGDWLLATDVDCCKYHTATGPRTTAPLAQVHTGGHSAGGESGDWSHLGGHYLTRGGRGLVTMPIIIMRSRLPTVTLNKQKQDTFASPCNIAIHSSYDALFSLTIKDGFGFQCS